MARTRIKICGIRDLTTALHAARLGADAIGLVFAEDSPRFVEPEEAFAIMGALPPLVTAVGVFKGIDAEAFADVEEVCPTQVNQLHDADERTVKACGPDVIKAIAFDPATIDAELKLWDASEDVCALLVDSPRAGSGEVGVDWKRLGQAAQGLSKPLFLAGGLTPQNVGEAIALVRPYAVDVSSGVERERGVKDLALIEAFCEAVRRADGR